MVCYFVCGVVEYWIKRKQSIAGKIHLRDETRREGWSKNRKMDMGGPPGIVVIAPGIRAGTNGNEAITAFSVRDRVAPTAKIRIKRSIVLIHFVKIPARSVSLPNLDQRVGKRAIVLVEDAAPNDDALAKRMACM